MEMRLKNYKILSALLLIISLLLYGCTPEKAKALQTAAIQFKVEALKALDMIDSLREHELAPPAEPQTKLISEFVSGVSEYTGTLTPEKIGILVAPYKISEGNRQETEWDKKRISLRQQYTEFAALFDRLHSGSYLVAEAVEKSKIPARDLTLQMAAFAKVIRDNPPQFIQYRSKFLADLTKIKNDKTLTNEKRAEAIAPYFERWQNLIRDEHKMGNETVAQCLKASLIGKSVCELIETYKQISIDDLNTIISLTLDTVGAITGKDTTRLSQKVNDTISAIKSDEIWAGAVDGILKELNEAARARMNVS
jgi:hypothetical protein